jgi:hypothetical protein
MFHAFFVSKRVCVFPLAPANGYASLERGFVGRRVHRRWRSVYSLPFGLFLHCAPAISFCWDFGLGSTGAYREIMTVACQDLMSANCPLFIPSANRVNAIGLNRWVCFRCDFESRVNPRQLCHALCSGRSLFRIPKLHRHSCLPCLSLSASCLASHSEQVFPSLSTCPALCGSNCWVKVVPSLTWKRLTSSAFRCVVVWVSCGLWDESVCPTPFPGAQRAVVPSR